MYKVIIMSHCEGKKKKKKERKKEKENNMRA